MGGARLDPGADFLLDQQRGEVSGAREAVRGTVQGWPSLAAINQQGVKEAILIWKVPNHLVKSSLHPPLSMPSLGLAFNLSPSCCPCTFTQGGIKTVHLDGLWGVTAAWPHRFPRRTLSSSTALAPPYVPDGPTGVYLY